MREHCGVIVEVKARYVSSSNVQAVEGRSFKNFKQREPSVSMSYGVLMSSWVWQAGNGRSRFETDIADQHWEASVRMKAQRNRPDNKSSLKTVGTFVRTPTVNTVKFGRL